MWETLFNILKFLGALSAMIAAIVICARVWSGAARERMIGLLETELTLARQHSERCDTDVRHYRDEMHTTRDECAGEISKAELELELLREGTRQLEIENAGLRAKTDLSPVMETMTLFINEQRHFITEQTAINGQVLAALTKLSGT